MKKTLEKKLKKGISVVIITRNRANDLNRCLSSLIKQSLPVNEIIIVDNFSQDQTKDISNRFIKNSTNIKYFLEKKIGFPAARNRGLKESSYEYVAFVDDDCVVDSNWFKNTTKFIGKNSEFAVAVGNNKTFYKNNIFSVLFLIIDQYWKINSVVNNKVLNYQILDTKNIVYNKKWLNLNRISFDESLINNCFGAGEDIVIGSKIFSAGGKAFFNKDMVIFHKDPTNIFSFIKKYIFSRKTYINNIKDNVIELKIEKKKNITRLRTIFIKLTRDLNLLKKLSILILLFIKVMVDFISLPILNRSRK